MMQRGFAKRLLAWYERHGRRDLPWQQQVSPYRIWVSEIMLQQTQVATVIPYYARFLRRFPDVAHLADAQVDEVLHLWTGLGYYARARNLHRAARMVRDEHRGTFPTDVAALQALPGIGRSTAGAILALACGQRHPILDGNVKRVLTRVHAIEGWPGKRAVEQRLWHLATTLTPRQHVGAYTQAIMDLGATVCTRVRPACADCPVSELCQARALGRATDFPSPRPRKPLPIRRCALLLLRNGRGEVLLERRPPSGIWGGLWSFPEVTREDAQDTALRALCSERFGCRVRAIETDAEFRHTFSHFHLDILPLHIHVEPMDTLVLDPGNRVWYNTERSGAHGLPAPIKRLLQQATAGPRGG